jgi:hypothetical protein
MNATRLIKRAVTVLSAGLLAWVFMVSAAAANEHVAPVLPSIESTTLSPDMPSNGEGAQSLFQKQDGTFSTELNEGSERPMSLKDNDAGITVYDPSDHHPLDSDMEDEIRRQDEISSLSF